MSSAPAPPHTLRICPGIGRGLDFFSFPAIQLKDFTSFVVFTPTSSKSVLLGDAAKRDWLRVEPGQVKAKWHNTLAIAKGGKQVLGRVQLLSVVLNTYSNWA